MFLTVLASCVPEKQTNTEDVTGTDPAAAGEADGLSRTDDSGIEAPSGASVADNGSDSEKDDPDSSISDNEADSSIVYESSANTDDQAPFGRRSELLQSASVDLNGDGSNEQVRAMKLQLPASGTDEEVFIEGRLVITDGDITKQVVFREKEKDSAVTSEFLSNMEFEDLDGDGAKDIFLVIPGYGASFSYSGCFIYSYKKDLSYSFLSDNTLADFIGSFRFKYINGGDKLTVTNEQYGFTADLTIEDTGEGPQQEEIMYSYADRTWIDPVSIDISEDSRLSLVKRNNRSYIKVPLPVFGLATVDMIAEIDLFYSIDENFEPVLIRCEVIDFSGDKKVISGSFDISSR